jgi:hypothetical protein
LARGESEFTLWPLCSLWFKKVVVQKAIVQKAIVQKAVVQEAVVQKSGC